MGFGFRKSKNFGGVRLNLSKSGLGVSCGVKGFRVSHNSKGTYLNAGRGGLYYRKKLSSKSNYNSNNTIENENYNFQDNRELASLDIDFENYNFLDEKFTNYLFKKKIIDTISVILLIFFFFANLGIFLFVYFVHFFINHTRKKKIQKYISTLNIIDTKDLFKEQIFNSNTLNPVKMLDFPISFHRDLYGLLKEKISLFSTTNIHGSGYCLLFSDKGIYFIKSDRAYFVSYSLINLSYVENEEILNYVPENAEIVEQTWEHTNKDGSKNKRYKENNEIYKLKTYNIELCCENNFNLSFTMFDKNSYDETIVNLEKLIIKEQL